MKFKPFLLAAFCLTTLSGCSPTSAVVNVHNADGTITQYEVKFDQTFSLNNFVTHYEDDYFLGCFASASPTGERYVGIDGVSIPWIKDYPTDIYACYQRISTLNITSNELFAEGEYTLGGSIPDAVTIDENHGFRLDFGDVYGNYFAVHADELFDVNVTFQHFEFTESIFVNWANYDIYFGSKTNAIGSGSLSSIDKYQVFDKTYQVKGSDIAAGKGGITVLISAPDGNLAKASGLWYKKFKAHITPGVVLTKDNVSYETNGKEFEYYADDGGFPLSKAAKTNGTTIEMPQIPALLNEKYEPEEIKVTYLMKGSGKKTLGIFDNWADFKIIAKDKKGEEVGKVKDSIGTGSNNKNMEFETTFTGEQFAKIESFVFEFTHGGTAAAQEVYFIYYLGLRINF